MENLKPEDIKQINLYLHQLMEKDELQAFEIKLKNNPELAGEVEVRRIAQVYQFIKTKDQLKELRDQMMADGELKEKKDDLPIASIPGIKREEGLNNDESSTGKVISMWPKRLALAAAILGVMSVGAWFLINQKNPSKDIATKPSIEQEDGKTEPVNPSTIDMVNGLLSEARQPRENVPDALKDAVKAFESEKNEEAIKLLRNQKGNVIVKPGKDGEYGASQEEIEMADPVFEAYRKFYLGVSYLQKGDPQKALVYLKQVKKPLVGDARWYMALAYLKNNQPVLARPILKEISSNTNAPYSSEAELLLKELK